MPPPKPWWGLWRCYFLLCNEDQTSLWHRGKHTSRCFFLTSSKSKMWGKKKKWKESAFPMLTDRRVIASLVFFQAVCLENCEKRPSLEAGFVTVGFMFWLLLCRKWRLLLLICLISGLRSSWTHAASLMDHLKRPGVFSLICGGWFLSVELQRGHNLGTSLTLTLKAHFPHLCHILRYFNIASLCIKYIFSSSQNSCYFLIQLWFFCLSNLAEIWAIIYNLCSMDFFF